MNRIVILSNKTETMKGAFLTSDTFSVVFIDACLWMKNDEKHFYFLILDFYIQYREWLRFKYYYKLFLGIIGRVNIMQIANME